MSHHAKASLGHHQKGSQNGKRCTTTKLWTRGAAWFRSVPLCSVSNHANPTLPGPVVGNNSHRDVVESNCGVQPVPVIRRLVRALVHLQVCSKSISAEHYHGVASTKEPRARGIRYRRCKLSFRLSSRASPPPAAFGELYSVVQCCTVLFFVAQCCIINVLVCTRNSTSLQGRRQ